MKNEIENLETFTRHEVENMIRDSLRPDPCGYGQWYWRAKISNTKLAHYSTDATLFDKWKNASGMEEQAEDEATQNLVDTFIDEIKHGDYSDIGLYFCPNSAQAVNDCKFMVVPEKYFDIGTCIYDLIDAGNTCRIEDAFSNIEEKKEK